mgnify:CR=1 FL=1
MEDAEIIRLYNARSEEAISETAQKYGHYCHSIAMNILSNEEDAEESVNDTWYAAWQSIPPQRPQILSVFLGRLTRNFSLDRWRKLRASGRTSPSRSSNSLSVISVPPFPGACPGESGAYGA